MAKRINKVRQARRKKRRSRQVAGSNARRYAPNDGGAWALAGYAYQFLGSAVLTLSNDYALPDDAGNLTLHVETYGQDTVAKQPNSVELIQFKFSSSATDIGPQEFADILRAFEASTGRAGVRNVTWKLITNRELSKRTIALRDGPSAKRGTTSLTDAAIIKKCGTRCARDARTSTDFQAVIKARARSFGATDTEIESAKHSVSGYLLALAGEPEGNRIIKKDRIDEYLAGCAAPRSLRPDEFSAFLQQELAQRAKELDLEIDDIVPRRVVDQLLNRRDIAIAVVTCHGGCGKTRGVLKALSDGVAKRRWLVGALLPGPYPIPESFERLVTRWRSKHQLTPEDAATCWRRIRIATNGSPKPVVVLDLDGIDEVGAGQSAARNVEQLIGHFRSIAEQVEPEGLLIVTCRKRDTLDSFIQYEGTGATATQGVEEFVLGDFDWREFVLVWDKWFPGEVLPEAARVLSVPPVMGGAEEASSRLHVRVQALMHPALLGCTRLLTAGERQDLFDGDDTVWIKLLEHYRGWFARKVLRRKGYDPPRVEAMLKDVARACELLKAPPDTYDLEAHWCEPARSDPGRGEGMIRDVFQDAISCGLIDSPGSAPYTTPDRPVPWRWRFRFLQGHLAKLL